MLQRHSEKPERWERCGHFMLYEAEGRATFLKQSATTTLEGCVCENHDNESGEHTIVLVGRPQGDNVEAPITYVR